MDANAATSPLPTIVREIIIQKAVTGIRQAIDGLPSRHKAFTGPDGLGKTHLLNCIAQAIAADGKLKERTAVLHVHGAISAPLSFADLLLFLCRDLSEAHPDNSFLQAVLQGNEAVGDDGHVSSALTAALAAWCKAEKQHLVILLDDADRLPLLMKAHGEATALAGFLAEFAHCTCLLTATSKGGLPPALSTILAEVSEMQALGFSEFLDLISMHAKRVGNEGLIERLRLKETEWGRLHGLLGGSPRLATALVRLMLQSPGAPPDQILLVLADRMTPHYRAVLNALSPAQRALLDVLSELPAEGRHLKGIAGKMRTTNNVASSHIHRLVQAGILASASHGHARPSLYRTKDPFLTYWLGSRFCPYPTEGGYGGALGLG